MAQTLPLVLGTAAEMRNETETIFMKFPNLVFTFFFSLAYISRLLHERLLRFSLIANTDTFFYICQPA